MSSSDNKQIDIFAKAFKTPEELEKMMVDSNPILGNFILKGQISFIYGPPNSGKTLLIMSLLNDVNEDIIYLNADDGINEGTEKVALAQEQNYMMVLCGTDNSNDPKNLMQAIEQTVKTDNKYYKNKIVIFDTVKKFVDPMNKQATAGFLQLMRKITLAGGTIVLLGHTNKYKDNEELVFEGVGDWKNDVDCVYSLDFEYNDVTHEKVIIFDNHKSRGIVPQTVSYKYNASKSIENFEKRIATVEEISNSDVEYLKQRSEIKMLESKHEDALDFIIAILKKHGELTQSAIRDFAKEDDGSNISDSEIRKCLKAFEDIKWKVTTNASKNNAKEYHLKV